jgi:AcrR family transcriptional regulator
MAQRTDLAERILQESSRLFREQGYAATTIKQIAAAAGCTTAALYYYYEGGKSEILYETIRSFQTPDQMLAGIPECRSLSEFMVALTSTLAPAVPRIADQVGWLVYQFPTLPAEEKNAVQSRIMRTHDALVRQLVPFTADGTEADRLAWLIFNAFVGYQQVFLRAEIGRVADLDLQAYGRFMAGLVDRPGGHHGRERQAAD